MDHIDFKIGSRGTVVFESPVQKWLLTPDYYPSNMYIYNFNKTFFKVIRQIDLKKNLFTAQLGIIMELVMLEYFIYNTLEGPVKKILLNPEDIIHYHPSNKYIYNFNQSYTSKRFKEKFIHSTTGYNHMDYNVLIVLEYFVYNSLIYIRPFQKQKIYQFGLLVY